MSLSAEDALTAANEAFGRHPGHRALHARGTLLKGTFTATPEAAALTRAAHMQGEPVPVTVRVSNGSGDPGSGDHVPDVRGLAIKFYLLDDSRTDLVMQTAPRFPVHTPEAFLELVRAQKRTRSAFWRLPVFLLRHPGAAVRLPANTWGLLPPESYATCSYYAIHAFRFVGAGGEARFVRYTLLPDAGERHLNPLRARRLGPQYLQQEIRRRLDSAPVRFTLQLQVAAPDDEVDDPASDWPAERQRVNAGTLELTGLDTERETGDDVLVFDPTRVCVGIELSADPVLRYRSPAYRASVAERT
ncbi:MAG: catalase family peroxidase [Actinomycetota bacterium]|nr:catalase family peroxidase [Actinomycetota bacterium]